MPRAGAGPMYGTGMPRGRKLEFGRVGPDMSRSLRASVRQKSQSTFVAKEHVQGDRQRGHRAPGYAPEAPVT